MEINDKIARCRLLATLVVADDNVEESELEFLERAMERFELTEEDKVKVMVLLDEDEALEAIESLPDNERHEFLNDLAEIAWIDGDLDRYEIDQVHKVATAMGFNALDVERALDSANPES